MSIDKPTPGNLIHTVAELVDTVNGGGGGGLPVFATDADISLTSNLGTVTLVGALGLEFDGGAQSQITLNDIGGLQVPLGVGVPVNISAAAGSAQINMTTGAIDLVAAAVTVNGAPIGGGGGGGAEIIIANTVYSPASWVAKAKYTVVAGANASIPINTAIAELAVGGGGVGGGTVLLAPGIYFLATDITLTDGVTLAGATDDNFNTQVAVNGVQIKCTNNKRVGLKNMTLEAYLNWPTGKALVDFNNAANIYVENLLLQTAGLSAPPNASNGEFLFHGRVNSGGYFRRIDLAGSYDMALADYGSNFALVQVIGANGGYIGHIHDNIQNAGNVSAAGDAFASIFFSPQSSIVEDVYSIGGGTVFIGSQYGGASGVISQGAHGNGILIEGSGDCFLRDSIVTFAGGGSPGGYSGIEISGDRGRVANCNVYNCADALYGLHVAGGTNNIITDNFLVAGASGANFQDDGITTRSADNIVA